ncbi:aminoacyl-tRNA hydrolase [Marinicella gelatinilytica]|uniref:aminoacyl-tRNA hydrolase n=1 Tax=Marinicella gelatinilytica TaxID=2996017 RepID=UPI002260C45D|nr:aminoacyl-tRNA hydrolase [Marinicella gelatinilytica]
MIQVIFGLGNPGQQYQATRHNAGFWYLDALASHVGCTFKQENKFKAEVAHTDFYGEKLWLVKPQTYMNRSGQTVIPFCQFYRIPTNRVVVAYDELDIPPGTAKFKRGGGHSGHNGLRDIIPGLGADFKRLRIGIGHPGDKSKVTPWVLGRPHQDDAIAIVRCIEQCVNVTEDIVALNDEKVMQILHTVADK